MGSLLLGLLRRLSRELSYEVAGPMRYYDLWEVSTPQHYGIYFVYPSPFSQNIKIRSLLNNDVIYGESEFTETYPMARLVYRKQETRGWRT